MPNTLEPKVAKLEVLMESITKDAVHLAEAVERLADKVDAVAMPRAIQWQSILTAGILALSLGAAALGPILWRVDALHTDITRLSELFDSHQKLLLHPVGSARVDELEKMMLARMQELTKELDIVRTQGTPITSSRLGVLESRVDEIQRRINVLHPIHLHHPGDEDGSQP